MIELAIVLSVAICAYICRIYLQQRQQEIDYKHKINIQSTTVDLSSAYDEQFKLFDDRMVRISEEVNAIKLGISLKNGR
jgi:hypothetical protein